MFNLTKSVLLLALIAAVCAYPWQERYAKLTPNVDCHNFPPVLSYHVHVTYMLTNNKQIAAASAFRDAANKHFAPMLDADPACPGTVEEPSGRYGEQLFSVYNSFLSFYEILLLFFIVERMLFLKLLLIYCLDVHF